MYGEAGKKAVGLTIIIAIILVTACVVISGCNNTQESGYIDKLNSIVDQYNNFARQSEQAGSQFGSEINAAANNADAAAALAGINQTIDKYFPQFQQYQAQHQQLQAELNALQPPARFANNHARLIQGMDTTAQAYAELLNGLNLLRDPNTHDAAMTAADNALAKEDEGVKTFNEAVKGVSVIKWPLLIAIIAGVLVFVLVVGSALGYWSGRIAKNNGHGFWGFFFVGFFLGLIGVLITWLVTKEKKPRDAQPVYLGQIPPTDFPGQLAPPVYPELQAPPPAGPKSRVRAVTPGKTVPCRYCGAQVPITKPKCPSCGRMMMGL
jgi:outer membrane murein-binding lipoprotein Lpp/F0F1-type ATP synthase assembly protein I